jgi:hypothetical protein
LDGDDGVEEIVNRRVDFRYWLENFSYNAISEDHASENHGITPKGKKDYDEDAN